MCFRCLEVSNSVRNWNKFKKFKYVRSILQLCQLEIPILIYKLMCQSSFINSVSFVFCEFNRVGSWNEGKTTIIISNSQIELQVTYSRSTYVKIKILFLIVILKETLVLMCLVRHFDIIDSLILFVWHRDVYYTKLMLNTFVCVEVRILVEMWNIYKDQNFRGHYYKHARLPCI